MQGKTKFEVLRRVFLFQLVIIFVYWVIPATAQNLFVLSPAIPQPNLSKLKPGLAVRYAYGDVLGLDQAATWLNHAKPGKPLAGFIYGDTELGQKVMTSDARVEVIAFIQGFMRFEKGIHELEFHSNDGLRVALSKTKVYEHDGRHPCETAGSIKIQAPKTGWYAVEALYFQRMKTACLDLSMRRPGGDWDWTDPRMYAHLIK